MRFLVLPCMVECSAESTVSEHVQPQDASRLRTSWQDADGENVLSANVGNYSMSGCGRRVASTPFLGRTCSLFIALPAAIGKIDQRKQRNETHASFE